MPAWQIPVNSRIVAVQHIPFVSDLGEKDKSKGSGPQPPAHRAYGPEGGPGFDLPQKNGPRFKVQGLC